MRITNTNGNKKNGIKGGRVTICDDSGTIIDQFEISIRFGTAQEYCLAHRGKYQKRYLAAIKQAIKNDSEADLLDIMQSYDAEQIKEAIENLNLKVQTEQSNKDK